MKPMANPGTVEYKYRRNYIAVNPDPALGPVTWRTASPQEIAGTGSGGTGERYEFDGTAPVDIDTTVNGGTAGRTLVETTIDISQLDDRAD